MSKKQNGSIQFTDNSIKLFKAADKKKALVIAQGVLGVRSLTRRVIDKLGVQSIRFGSGHSSRIIFPVKRKRTLEKHKDRQMNRGRPVCTGKHLMDIGRRQHSGGNPQRIAA